MASEDTTSIEPNRLYHKADLCAMFGVTSRCIEKRVAKKQLPQPNKKIGRDPIWMGESLLRWMKR